MLISAIPWVRDNAVFKQALTYTLLVVPLNQITMGLSAIYSVAQVGAYKTSLFGLPPPTAADFFVWEVNEPAVPQIDGSPGPLVCIMFSIISLPMWFFLLWYIDVRRYYYAAPPLMGTTQTTVEDPDVAEERRRVETGGAAAAAVRMVHLSKHFPAPKKKGKKMPNKIAVSDLSLAIDGKGCFALLGPNGAGKTTVLSILTGEQEATRLSCFEPG